MFRITSIAKPNKGRGIYYYISAIIGKTSGFLEVLFLILFWGVILGSSSILGGFTRQEMITYIIFGNIIGLVTGYFLQRIITEDIFADNSKLLLYKPMKYFYHVLLKSFGRNFLPFILGLVLHSWLIYFFLDSFVVNFEKQYLIVIGIMMMLAFITELLIAYLAKFFIFWSVESRDLYSSISRLKKFFAGAYFPLSLLPALFFKFTLFFPFAYTFFVPTELYLKKIEIEAGIQGIIIQMIWIAFLYISIRIIWKNKTSPRKKEVLIEKNEFNLKNDFFEKGD